MHLTTTFLRGLGVVLPIALTIYLVVWIAGAAETLLKPLALLFIPDQYYIPGSGLVLGIVLVSILRGDELLIPRGSSALRAGDRVVHAGGQDLEIIYNLTGKTPHPLFDTQIAAMALGLGEQIGYGNLVDAWMGVTLDKGARFTDWARRPLDKRQIDYAIGDVTYLIQIFPMMLEKLRATGRGDWLDDEMERIGEPSNYENLPEEAWKRVRISSRKPDVLGRLKALAAWRETEARDKNIPRGRIVKDETLADMASHPPRGI